MYIARRTGGGRGVYEIAGQTATGLAPVDLIGRTLTLEFDAGLTVPLGLSLNLQGGKPRIVMDDPGYMQIQRQLAAILLLPQPRRDNNNWSDQYKIPVRQSYVIDQVQLAFVDLLSSSTETRIVPEIVSLRNNAGEWFVEVDDRLRSVEYIWSRSSQLSGDLKELVDSHQELVTAGTPILSQCEAVVSQLYRAAGQDEDILQTLLSMQETVGGQTARERVWKQIVQRRGQRRFREILLQSYQETCQVTGFTGVEALEAAHIVPYAAGQYQANDPTNGLLLRADIHTLFDLDLLKVDPNGLKVRIMEPLHSTSYMRYHDAELRTSNDLQPSLQALASRWDQ